MSGSPTKDFGDDSERGVMLGETFSTAEEKGSHKGKGDSLLFPCDIAGFQAFNAEGGDCRAVPTINARAGLPSTHIGF